jgi:hypothetical protein
MDVLVALAKGLAGALLIAFAYGLPALVAVHRRHDRAEAIALLDLLLGWTVLGWLVLLAWALEWTPRRSRLWRRLARGWDGGTRWTAPRSGGGAAPRFLTDTSAPREGMEDGSPATGRRRPAPPPPDARS